MKTILDSLKFPLNCHFGDSAWAKLGTISILPASTVEEKHDDHLSSRHMVPALTSASAAKCSSHTLGPQLCVDVLVSVDDKRRPGGTEGWLQGYWEETGLVAAGVRWGVRGHQKGVKRKAENTVITHPGLFLSGPLAAGGRDQLGFVTLSRVIQWWSGPFL